MKFSLILRQLTWVLFCSLSINAYALQCPKAVTNATFIHQTTPTVDNTHPWMIDMNYAQQGWYIIKTPMSEYATATTVYSDSVLTVVLNGDHRGNYYMMCEYTIRNGNGTTKLTVANDQALKTAPSSRFAKISEDLFTCATKSDRPDLCSNANEPAHTMGLSQYHSIN